MGLGPFDLTGGPFLILYLTLLLAVFIAGLVIPRRLRPPGRTQAVTDPDMLAVLSGGKSRFVDALVARLLARGALLLSGKDGFMAAAGARGETAAELRVLALSAPIRFSTIMRQLADYAEPVARKLSGSGLYMSDDDAARIRWWQTLPYVLLIGFGTIKLMIGEARGRPVGYLTALLVLTAIGTAIRWFVLDRRTRAGLAAVAEAGRRHDRLKRAPTAGEVGTAVALFGTGVLAGSAWHDFHRMRVASDGGSSSGDSGGDGGGGCGGGCGGCGS